MFKMLIKMSYHGGYVLRVTIYVSVWKKVPWLDPISVYMS